ncbi:MAG: hypothetical protein F9K32_16625 [Desulfobulbaceae bacterium]|nr:MAG: hypothetical protein F9K32_16625 [Desulfobulbaceae bacterium]
MAFDRDALLAKLRKLKAMTTAAGCTEAEALRAAEIMGRLLDEHGMSADEITADQYVEEPTDTRRRRRNRVEAVWSVVAWYCDCAMFIQINDDGRHAVYFGVEPRPTIARYLHDIVEDTAAWAIAEFRRGAFYKARRTAKTRKAAVDTFVEGFISGLLRKLALKKSAPINPAIRDAAAAELKRVRSLSPQRALAPLKRAARFDDARAAGASAGYRTEINDGVGQAVPVALIGSD